MSSFMHLRMTLRQMGCLLGCAVVLIACGGGVDSGGTGSYVAGPITGFGSIIVGGVHYDESAAQVQDEFGASRRKEELKLGMLTEIEASAPTGPADAPTATAKSVRFRSEIVGPVEFIDAAGGTLIVLGQTVKIGPTTVFDASLVGGLTALTGGDVVEVFGQFDASGPRYTATRIEPRTDPGTLFKLRGRLSSFDRVAKTLVVGGQTISIAAIAPAPTLVIGQTLRVRLQRVKIGSAWDAVAISVGVTALPARDDVGLEGRITSFTSINEFEVDGIPVTTSATTLFLNGAGAVVLGASVEVKGRSRNGVVQADRIKVDDGLSPRDFQIIGTISASDPVAKTFVLHEVAVHYSDATQFKAGSSAGDVQNGRLAEVKGVLSSGGTVLEASAIRVER